MEGEYAVVSDYKRINYCSLGADQFIRQKTVTRALQLMQWSHSCGVRPADNTHLYICLTPSMLACHIIVICTLCGSPKPSGNMESAYSAFKTQISPWIQLPDQRARGTRWLSLSFDNNNDLDQRVAINNCLVCLPIITCNGYTLLGGWIAGHIPRTYSFVGENSVIYRI